MAINTQAWSKASFRVVSASLTAADISNRLGLAATRAHEAGERVSSTSGSPVHREAGWFLESGLDDREPMDRHLVALLDQLEPRVDRLRDLASECRMDLFCGFSSESGQGGFILSPGLLERLARIPGEGLVLDLYPPEKGHR
jgi:hypothetical protein